MFRRFSSPVEDDPQWVKEMTCALDGHKWNVPPKRFHYALRDCEHCGIAILPRDY
jgi:hypothetical protein